MRIGMTLIMFVIVGSTLAGVAVIALLLSPMPEAEVFNLFLWVALAGFALALPISAYLASSLTNLTKPKA